MADDERKNKVTDIHAFPKGVRLPPPVGGENGNSPTITGLETSIGSDGQELMHRGYYDSHLGVRVFVDIPENTAQELINLNTKKHIS